jgi:hypothetical protein
LFLCSPLFAASDEPAAQTPELSVLAQWTGIWNVAVTHKPAAWSPVGVIKAKNGKLLPHVEAVHRGAKPQSTADTERTPAEQYRSLLQEYQTAKQQYLNAARNATTEGEKANAQRMRPDHVVFARRALEFAEKHPKDAAAVDALQWIAVELWRPGAEKVLERALDILVKDHIGNEKLHRVCQRMGSYGPWFKPAQRVLREIMDKSPHHNVQGHACFALARHLGQLDLEAERRKRDELELGVIRAHGDKANRENFRVERAELLKRVFQQYGKLEFDSDVALAGKLRGNLADAAQRELFEIRNIAVGHVALDIEGEDVEGKRFRLSDYRGKVVLLHFWAFG